MTIRQHQTPQRAARKTGASAIAAGRKGPKAEVSGLQALADASPQVASLSVFQRAARHGTVQREPDDPGGLPIYGSEQLHQAALQGGDAKKNAVTALTAYFDQSMLGISKVHSVYASSYDKKTGEVGAEFYVKARDPRVAEIADQWVFHTHAVAETREVFSFKRDFGANHVKPAANPYGRVSLSFHSDNAFGTAEANADIQRSFTGALRRALQKTDKDPYAARKDKTRKR